MRIVSTLAVKTLLVVEDDQLNLKLVTMILVREGYRVIGAETAETGLSLAHTETRPWSSWISSSRAWTAWKPRRG